MWQGGKINALLPGTHTHCYTQLACATATSETYKWDKCTAMAMKLADWLKDIQKDTCSSSSSSWTKTSSLHCQTWSAAANQDQIVKQAGSRRRKSVGYFCLAMRWSPASHTVFTVYSNVAAVYDSTVAELRGGLHRPKAILGESKVLTLKVQQPILIQKSVFFQKQKIQSVRATL